MKYKEWSSMQDLWKKKSKFGEATHRLTDDSPQMIDEIQHNFFLVLNFGYV
ncbi:hypothetical protein [Flagellimonas sp.]|uniref:hypothetical protein n=1 Tax=Flagellimonas sp. TaxID=2058762 RepID=UPI003F4A0493